MPTSTFTASAAIVLRHTTVAAIQQALVVRMRASAALRTASTGGFHEGFAPEKVSYPTVVYNLVADPNIYTWGSMMHIATFDVRVISTSSVDAGNVDALIYTALDDAALVVDGQTTFHCSRAADFRIPDTDEEGQKVYQVGGSYEIWTDQAR